MKINFNHLLIIWLFWQVLTATSGNCCLRSASLIILPCDIQIQEAEIYRYNHIWNIYLCTLYKLFIIMEHAESSNERIQVETLPKHLGWLKLKWKTFPYRFCSVIIHNSISQFSFISILLKWSVSLSDILTYSI